MVKKIGHRLSVILIIQLTINLLIVTPFMAKAIVKSDALSGNNILVTNNITGIKDEIDIMGVLPGDVVRVYASQYAVQEMVWGKVEENKKILSLYVEQLDSVQKKLYISVTSTGKSESDRTEVSYSSELQTNKIDPSNITVTNISVNINNKKDNINVKGVSEGDIIKVYGPPPGEKPLNIVTVVKDETEVNISMSQLASNGGTVYITATSKGRLESEKTEVNYMSEPKSDKLALQNINIVNNYGDVDKVCVIGLTEGDIVKTYIQPTGGKELSATNNKVGKDRTTVEACLKLPSSMAGIVYLTVTRDGKTESDRIAVNFAAETKSNPINPGNVITTNNAGEKDKILVKNLLEGDVVKVYTGQTEAKPLVITPAVQKEKTEIEANIKLPSPLGGVLYISVTTKTKLESDRTRIDYEKEQITDKLAPDDITITNNAGDKDTISIKGLTEGDIIRVYSQPSGGKELPTTNNKVLKGSTEINANIKLQTITAGVVFITLTSTFKNESDRTVINYGKEPQAEKLDTSDIIITNNAGGADKIKVEKLSEGDIIKVYTQEVGGNTLVTAPAVLKGESEIETNVKLPSSVGGTLYFSVMNKNKLESDRVGVIYNKELQSDKIDSSDIKIINYAGDKDKITIGNLSEGDIIKVYKQQTGGEVLVTTGALLKNQVEVNAIFKLPTTSAGTVYVSVTKKNKLESDRTAAGYLQEVKSDKIDVGNVKIKNNANAKDIISVSQLSEGDVVKLYGQPDGGKAIAIASPAPKGITEVNIETQLTTTSGIIYLSLTNKGKLEGDLTSVNYEPELKSNPIDAGNLSIINAAWDKDIINVKNLTEGDIVKVYEQQAGGKEIGATNNQVGKGKTEVNCIVKLSTSGAGIVYISVTSMNKAESDRTEKSYIEEPKSDILVLGAVKITNNAGSLDLINVTGLAENDVIRVYEQQSGGKELVATNAKVEKGKTVVNAIVKLPSSNAGEVYLTVTNPQKNESGRLLVNYSNEIKSDGLDSGKIIIINNKGTDVIFAYDLAEGDVIKVYDAETLGTLLGTSTVANGQTQVLITINKLLKEGGYIYITVTNVNKLESDRLEMYYDEEL